MTDTSVLAGKTLLITGGTGSFGSTVLRHFLRSEIAEIRIFSRDEKKQDDMRHRLQERCPELAGKVRFHVGDVRDDRSVRDAMRGVDYVFHAPARCATPRGARTASSTRPRSSRCPLASSSPWRRSRPT